MFVFNFPVVLSSPFLFSPRLSTVCALFCFFSFALPCIFFYLSQSPFPFTSLSSHLLLPFSWFLSHLFFYPAPFLSLLSSPLLSLSPPPQPPLTSSTVPVLRPPAPIDSLLLSHGGGGRDDGHWAEVSRAGHSYFPSSTVVISSHGSFVRSTDTSALALLIFIYPAFCLSLIFSQPPGSL